VTPPAPNSDASPPRPAYGGGLRPTNSATPTRRTRPRGVPLNVIQRQLGHTNLGVTSIYLQGIDNAEIIATVHARKAPMIPASTGLRI
jgi:integrase